MNSGFDPAKFAVTAFHSPSSLRPAFALPLVSQTPGGNALFAQEVGDDERVVDFSQLGHEFPSSNLIQPHPVTIGDRMLFVILGPDGEQAVGSRLDLADVAKIWAREVEFLLTRLSFLEFAGEHKEADSVARSLYRERVELLGNKAAKNWFVESVLFPRLLRIAGQSSYAHALDVALWTTKSTLNISMPSKLLQAIGNVDSHQGSRQLERIYALARNTIGLELSILSSHESKSPARRVSDSEILTRSLIECAKYVGSLPRQEERIAQTLSYVCTRPDIARRITSLIEPRAALERKALSLIDDLASNFAQDENREIMVERLVHELYRSGYPMRRGELIFEIATRVNSEGSDRAIRNLVEKTSSSDLARYRTAILAVLGD